MVFSHIWGISRILFIIWSVQGHAAGFKRNFRPFSWMMKIFVALCKRKVNLLVWTNTCEYWENSCPLWCLTCCFPWIICNSCAAVGIPDFLINISQDCSVKTIKTWAILISQMFVLACFNSDFLYSLVCLFSFFPGLRGPFLSSLCQGLTLWESELLSQA